MENIKKTLILIRHLLFEKGFEINYNAGYTKATYTALTVSQNSTTVNLQGKRQTFSPDVTSMLAIQYHIDIGKKKDMTYPSGANGSISESNISM